MPQAIRRRCLLNGLVMTMSELKACPFCGLLPKLEIKVLGGNCVSCLNGKCSVNPSTGWFDADCEEEAIAAWNTRADEARIRREAFEECAVMFDRDADEMEAVWNEFLASGSDGPGTSYHGIWRNIAAKIRALAEESSDA